jgi:hypothetical protein
VADLSKRKSHVLIGIMLAAGVLRLAMLAGAQTGAAGSKAKADMLQSQQPSAETAEGEGGGEEPTVLGLF